MNKYDWILATNKLPWNNMIFFAAAEKEDFCSINIITLKTHYRNTISDLAFTQVMKTNNVLPPPTLIKNEMKKIIDSGKITVQQFIEYDGVDHMTICLNKDQLKSDIEILDFLATFDKIFGLKKGKTTFGHAFTFTSEELNSSTETSTMAETLEEYII